MDRTSLVAEFWQWCRARLPELPEQEPEAWAFGADPTQADALLGLVLSGIKTATASSLWDYEYAGDRVPESGELSIILNGQGKPRALIETTQVDVIPFDRVSQEHAHAEGEGDRTLAYWSSVHQRYWQEHSESPRGFEPDMPVVLERIRLLLHADNPIGS